MNRAAGGSQTEDGKREQAMHDRRNNQKLSKLEFLVSRGLCMALGNWFRSEIGQMLQGPGWNRWVGKREVMKLFLKCLQVQGVGCFLSLLLPCCGGMFGKSKIWKARLGHRVWVCWWSSQCKGLSIKPRRDFLGLEQTTYGKRAERHGQTALHFRYPVSG